MQQRILTKLNALMSTTMERANASLGEHSQFEAIMGQVARAVGAQPNDLVVYEERVKDEDGKYSHVVRVGVRDRTGRCVPFEEAMGDNEGLNSVPPIRPEPWKEVLERGEDESAA